MSAIACLCRCIRSVYAFGSNAYCALGHFMWWPAGGRFTDNPAYEDRRGDMPLLGSVPSEVKDQSDWSQLSTCTVRSYGIDSVGRLWGWGSTPVGGDVADEQFFPGFYEHSFSHQYPVLVREPGPWKTVSSAHTHALAIKEDGTLWQWGHDVLSGATVTSKAVLRARLSAGILGVDEAMLGEAYAYSAVSSSTGRLPHKALYTETPSVVFDTVQSAAFSTPDSGSQSVPSENGQGASAVLGMNFWYVSSSVTNGGSGYRQAPIVTISDGEKTSSIPVDMLYSVESIRVTSQGNGYTSTPTVSIADRQPFGVPYTRATARVSKMGVVVTRVAVTAGGSGYSSAPAVHVNGQHAPSLQAVVANGQVASVVVGCNARFDETSLAISFHGGGGSGAAADAETILNHVVEVQVLSSGSNYNSRPPVSFLGTGVGAAAEAVVSGSVRRVSRPENDPTVLGGTIGLGGFKSKPTLSIQSESGSGASIDILYNAAVVSVTMTSRGSGYTSSKTLMPVARFVRDIDDRYFGQPTLLARCFLEPSPIHSITVQSSGAGYQSPHFSGGELDVLFVRVSPLWADDTRFTSRYDGSSARATASVSGGAVTSVAIQDHGQGYTVEPSCEPCGVVLYPRQLGSSTWVAVSAGSPQGKPCSVAIASDGSVYWWGWIERIGDIGPEPVRVGKRAIAVAAYSGPETFVGSQAVSFRFSRPPNNYSPAATATAYYEQSSGQARAITLESGWGYLEAPEVEEVTQGNALYHHYSVSSELLGPDGCQSVSVCSDGSVFAIDLSGRGWLLNSSQASAGANMETNSGRALVSSEIVLVDGEYETSESVSYEDPARTSSGYEHAVLVSGGSGYSKPPKLICSGKVLRWRIIKSERVSVSGPIPGANPPQTGTLSRSETYTIHSSGSIPYKDIELEDPKILWQGSLVHPAIVFPPWGSTLDSPLPAVPPFSTTNTRDESTGVSTGRLIVYFIETFESDPGVVLAIPEEGDESASPAVFETKAEIKQAVGGLGPSVIAEGKTWLAITTGGYGVLSDGTLVFNVGGYSVTYHQFGFLYPGLSLNYYQQFSHPLTYKVSPQWNPPVFPANSPFFYISPYAIGSPFPAAEQGKQYTDYAGAMARRSDKSLWLLGSPSNGSSACHGDVEIKIDDPGSGYTEPAMASFSAQPSGVARITTSINGEVSSIGVIDRGSGYETPPSVSFSGGGGSGAAATAVICGPVGRVVVTNPGSGYRLPPRLAFSQPGISAYGTTTLNDSGGVASVEIAGGGTYRSPPTVSFEPVPDLESIQVTSGGSGYSTPPEVVLAGGFGGTGAAATCKIDGSVVRVTVTSSGSGYTSPPLVTIAGSSEGDTATATSRVDSLGRVTEVVISSGGSMYQSAPAVSLTGGGGIGATAVAKIEGPVHSVDITSRGRDYNEPPLVFFAGGGGDGATATATTASPGSGAQATAFLNGELIYCKVTSGGTGYTSTPDVVVSGGGPSPTHAKVQARIHGPATATVQHSGSGYKATSNANDVGPSFTVLGPDDRGFYHTHPLDMLDESRTGWRPGGDILSSLRVAGTPQGIASLSQGGVSSVPMPSSVKFSSPPVVGLENTVDLRVVTNLRVAGVGRRDFVPKRESEAIGVSNEQATFTSTYEQYRKSNNWSPVSGTGGGRSSAPTFFTVSALPYVRGFSLVSGSGVQWKPAVAGGNYGAVKFEVPCQVAVESVTGSGAVISGSVDSSGTARHYVTSGGSDYGTGTRAVMKGGKVKVVDARATAVVVGGRVVAVEIESAGSGYYQRPPVVVIHGGGGSGATAVASINQTFGVAGGVTGIAMTSCGSGYTSTPTVSIVSSNIPWSEHMGIAFSALSLSERRWVDSIDGFQEKTGYFEFIELGDEETRASLTCHPVLSRGAAGNPLMNGNEYSFDFFFDDGYVESVFVESSFSRDHYHKSQRQRLPAVVSVDFSGKCDTQAAAAVHRPKWTNVFHSSPASCFLPNFFSSLPRWGSQAFSRFGSGSALGGIGAFAALAYRDESEQ